ncbi:NAD/ferredoxin-dependent reductase-like protein [Sediminihabitans luteus]|uniref:NAD/ferredoxin-dependent reductase-like protein n=1 Tax=Sediminihabitans luteus TaxID=1138585 RepID=A0A2M9CEF3_9CELL|nr:FAD-dependent oxidoreductase [Sediminihabitans luteus]PJJ70311.1 NAD/ferredoxin-dependent reductase-like protein [Sediminihabitans luteus]GII97782.1 pyridine nucleotide-disulfide oxidoreductase [Sediminihabitans luteus]
MVETFVLVGGGLASARAAETLRSEGFGGRIVLVGREGVRPYERPPLSKDYLRGEVEGESVFVHPSGWYDERDVRLRLGLPAVGLDPANHHLTLADGTLLTYDRLLLATGSTPRALPVAGGDLAGVVSLRTVGDSSRLAAQLGVVQDAGGRVVVLGSGWIGLEVASAARAGGIDVTVVGRSSVPLAGPLGAHLGGFFADLHREQGVRLVGDASAVALTGTDGRVTGVDLTTGEHLPADLVLVAIGALPEVRLASVGGLALDPTTGGVLTGPTLATSDPDVFAAGDVAAVPSERYGTTLRVEHWARANDQGPHAARAMLGSRDPYTTLPYFFTDQYDLGMEYTGYVAHPDKAEIVVSGSLEESEAVVFWIEDDRVAAGMALNVWDRQDDVAALIGQDEVDRAALEAFV